ncbi:MAG: UDP-glucose/GDP-mannose dehydrogenase family protein [Planctomycetota bacterium]|nr:UDP-glucose/GDP-mannose dehydrogenase family protein [Planctomycetota bacterium]
MKVAVVGTGYVGLVTGACFAGSGNDVICVDKDVQKLESLKKGKVPFFEPGLSELVLRNQREKRLSFTKDLAAAVQNSEIIFIAVGTPPKPDGSADLSAVFAVARGIADAMNGHKIVITKSTVPVGTTDLIGEEINKRTSHNFAMVNCPEFLKEGAALDDFLKPDRVVAGSNSENALQTVKRLYEPFLRTGAPFIEMDVLSSEMTKYVSNCLLASRISFMNEMANICYKLGADVQNVRIAVGADKRIGQQFLFPGVGFGGSCFPKDLEALAATARSKGVPSQMLEAAIRANKAQKRILFPKIMNHFSGGLEGLTFAVWGLSFKPRTDDMRDAPSIDIIRGLREMGVKVRAFDPEAMDNARKLFGDDIEYTSTNYEAAEGADALVVVTEWNEFRNPDFPRLGEIMKRKVVFDGRDIYNPKAMKEAGFHYYSIGRPDVN